jgi:ABC-type polysaccharide/polyol phosphate export permease
LDAAQSAALLLFLAVYTLVFSVIMKSSIHDFPLFLLAGMVPFFWFSGAVGTVASSIFSAAGYVCWHRDKPAFARCRCISTARATRICYN